MVWESVEAEVAMPAEEVVVMVVEMQLGQKALLGERVQHRTHRPF